tara:strand:- start:824 stop:1387 length:564 start_codon:yes stop_codon:yes gene_type:complete
MKIKLLLLVFLFATSLKAQNISEFEIEGISLGDSLLQSYNEEYILNNSDDFYGTDVLTFTIPETDFKSNSGYDTIQFAFLKNDKTYKIIQIAGGIFYDTEYKNIDSCNIKKNEIINELKNQFNIFFEDRSYSNENGDFYIQTKDYENGDKIRVFCTDWDQKIERENGWSDNLRIELLYNNTLSLMGF